MKKYYYTLLCLFTSISLSCNKADENILASQVEITPIWNTPGSHAAFTDLIQYNGYLYCVFREGPSHIATTPSEYGTIRLIASQDGNNWHTITVLEDPKYDLRDPKLSITPDNKLLIIYGAISQTSNDPSASSHSTQAVFLSGNPYQKSSFLTIDSQNHIIQPSEAAESWLWHITWYKGKAYGISYIDQQTSCRSFLLCSNDGIHYSMIREIIVPETTKTPCGINESCIDFDINGNMRVIARSKNTDQGIYATSIPPYTEWSEWKDLNITLGGPLIKTLENNTYIATRGHGTSLYKFNPTTLQLQAIAHSNMEGDTGYPGLIQYGNQLWMTFYHGETIQSESNIYLLKASF